MTNQSAEAYTMIREGVSEGMLSAADIKKIKERVQTPATVGAFKHLTAEEAIKIWSVATDEEKALLRGSYLKKKESIMKLPMARQRELMIKFRESLQ